MKCKHCGLESGGDKFCCLGCQTAYEIIESGGLSAFYQKAEHSYKKINPNKYEQLVIFDHPHFLENQTKKTGDYREAHFEIQNLYCSACIWLIEKLPQLDSNCVFSRVNISESKVFLRWKDENEALSKIAFLLEKLGYPISPSLKESRQHQKKEWLRIGITGGLAIACMHLGLYFLGSYEEGMDPRIARFYGFLSALLCLPILTYSSESFIKNAFHSLRMFRLHPDLLIIGAIYLGYVYSLKESFKGGIEVYYDSIAMIIFFLLLGRSFIQRTRQKMSKTYAWQARLILPNQETKPVPSEFLQKGDRIEVRAGESLPADALLDSSEAWFDYSVITGESAPRRMIKGQEIAQGASLYTKKAEFEILKKAENSNQALLMSELESPKNMIPSSLEQVFSLFIITLSLLSFFYLSIEQAMAILIVACPCALSLSYPLCLASLRKQSFANKIFLCRLDRIANFKGIKAIAFDKTGTLTKNKLEIVNQPAETSLSSKEASLAYTLAVKSEHPVAQAIALYLFDHYKIELQEMDSFLEVPGEGIQACSGNRVLELKKNQNNQEAFSSLFLVDKRVLAKFDLRDELRPEANEALSSLKERGLNLYLLTGDKKSSTQKTLKRLDTKFDHVFFEQSPKDKARIVGPSFAFAGDGLNDAYAFEKAGFAIGLTGSAESNLQRADAYLLQHDLRNISKLLKAIKKMRRRIMINYGVSGIYNMGAISLVLSGIAGPILCAIFMPLSSLSVILISYWKGLYKEE